jgi:predicted ATPase
MQPKSDAVERPLTLVEKLRNRRNEWASNPHYWMDSNLIGDVFNDVIDIVKQHSDWISVDERLPPDNMMVLAYCHIREATGYAFVSNQQAWSFYHFTKNSENQAWAMANDISKWMPIPQPPSEVQDD